MLARVGFGVWIKEGRVMTIAASPNSSSPVTCSNPNVNPSGNKRNSSPEPRAPRPRSRDPIACFTKHLFHSF